MHRLHDAGELADLNPHAERLMAPTRPREELYDLEEDPHELRNLAADDEHHDTLIRLRNELDAWIERIDDQGRFPEPPEVIEHWERQMRQNYDERLDRLRKSEAE